MERTIKNMKGMEVERKIKEIKKGKDE